MDTQTEELVHSSYVNAEVGTGENRVDETIEGSSGADIGSANSNVGQFLNAKNSMKSNPDVPGYSLF